MKRAFLVVACCLLTASVSFSQVQRGQTQAIRPKTKSIPAATTCPNDPVLMSDGTINGDDFIFANGTNYYTLNAKGGHSYSVEVWDVFDPTAAVSPTIKVTSDCNNSIAGVFDFTSADPDLSNGFSRRVSWIQGSDQTLYLAITNPDMNQNDVYDYYIRVTDTSLHNIHWSTWSYNTLWSLANLTSGDISGTLTVVNDQGVTVGTFPLTVPADGFAQVNAQVAKIPPNNQGAATFVYTGPAGAIRGDVSLIRNDGNVVALEFFVPQHSSF